jgi:hypothetical protein
MSMIAGIPADRGLARSRYRWLPYALLALGFAVVRPDVSGVTDVSWLITVCERVLEGQRLYVDLLETNPPASIWLYLPAVAAAHAVGVRPELMINGQFLALIAACLWLCARLAQSCEQFQDSSKGALLCAAFAMCALLPGGAFGQREHAGAILLLPVLCALNVRALGLKPARLDAILSGIAAGLALAIKPHFVLALGGGILAAAWLARTPRILFAPELWIAGSIAVLYGVAVYWLTPDFISGMLPVLQLTYIPARLPVLQMVTQLGVVVWVLILVFVLPETKARPGISILAAASLGGLAAFLVQGKGWPYHGLPMVLFALLAHIALVTAAPPAGRRSYLIAGLLLAVGLSAFWLGGHTATAPLRDALAALHPHPKMLQLGGDIAVGHPLVREAGGTWVGRICSNWQTGSAYRRLATEELDIVAEDIERQKPDIILVEDRGFNWAEQIDEVPRLKSAMAAYRDRGTVTRVRIMQRN